LSAWSVHLIQIESLKFAIDSLQGKQALPKSLALGVLSPESLALGVLAWLQHQATAWRPVVSEARPQALLDRWRQYVSRASIVNTFAAVLTEQVQLLVGQKYRLLFVSRSLSPKTKKSVAVSFRLSY